MTTLAPSAAPVSEALSGNESPDVRGASRPSRWRIPISDLRNALVQPPHGYAGPMDVVLDLRLADDTLLDRKPLRLEWAAGAPPQVNAVTQSPTDLKLAFEQFVENYTASTGQRTFSGREREILFKKFQQFLESQMSTRSAH